MSDPGVANNANPYERIDPKWLLYEVFVKQPPEEGNVYQAQGTYDPAQITSDFKAAREHARLATHYLIKATDHLDQGDPLLAILQKQADLYVDLTGYEL